MILGFSTIWFYSFICWIVFTILWAITMWVKAFEYAIFLSICMMVSAITMLFNSLM